MKSHRWTPRRKPGPYVAPVPIDPTGVLGPTRGAARGPRWRRTSRGFYVPAEVRPDTPEQRAAEAVPLLPPGGAVTGWAALRFHEVGFADGWSPTGPRPVPLLVGRRNSRHPRPGVDFLQDELDRVQVMYGIPCTPAPRALFDEMRRQPDVRDAVVAMDMAAAAEVVCLPEMQRYVAAQPPRLGVPLVREALQLADGASVSPQETRLRLVWLLDAGLPPPLVNVPVFDKSGLLLGYPDLLDERAGLVVEYDGDDHRAARRHSEDVDREAELRRAGLEVTRVTARDLRRVDRLVSRLHDARSRARFAATERRGWTLTPPEWFRPTLSAADRAALWDWDS